MRYILLVAHGEMAPGMKISLGMLVGERDDVLAVPFHDGMSQDAYRAQVQQTIAPITAADEVLILADLVGGSPLTGLMELMAAHVGLDKVAAVGGMNLPMAIAAVEGEDDPLAQVVSDIMAAAKEEIRAFATEVEEDSDDI